MCDIVHDIIHNSIHDRIHDRICDRFHDCKIFMTRFDGIHDGIHDRIQKNWSFTLQAGAGGSGALYLIADFLGTEGSGAL